MLPERQAFVESVGLRINVVEWGDPDGFPVVLCHGMFDHALGFAVVAPILAERFRVVAIDARGHGDSDWADAYNWPLDILDIVHVLEWIDRPCFVVGHSKGGGQATDAASSAPDRVRKVVNIDGFGPPPLAESQEPTPERFREFLKARHSAAEVKSWRSYQDFEQLVERRGSQNPRLNADWLRFFAYHGAREVDGEWCWKSDPHMAFTFGPWRPEWIAPGYRALQVPMLAITGSEPDTWGPLPAEILDPRLAMIRDVRRVTIDGAGHFVHMEKPRETAKAILEFLAA